MNKTIISVTGVLVVLAAITLIFDSQQNHKKNPLIGKTLLQSEDIEPIDRIEINRRESKFALIRDGQHNWSLDDEDKFPASGSKIARLADQLTKAKIVRTVHRSSDKDSEYGLDTATTLVLKAGEKIITQIYFGDQRQGGGHFARLDKDPAVFLLSSHTQVDTDKSAWSLKQLWGFSKEEINGISFDKPEAYKVEKTGEGNFTLPTIPEGKVFNDNTLDSLISSLKGLSFKDKWDPSNEEAKSALKDGSTLTLTFQDGQILNLKFGSTTGENPKSFMKMTVKGSKDSDDFSNQMKKLGEKYVFEFNKGSLERLTKKPDDWLKDAPKAENEEAKAEDSQPKEG